MQESIEREYAMKDHVKKTDQKNAFMREFMKDMHERMQGAIAVQQKQQQEIDRLRQGRQVS